MLQPQKPIRVRSKPSAPNSSSAIEGIKPSLNANNTQKLGTIRRRSQPTVAAIAKLPRTGSRIESPESVHGPPAPEDGRGPGPPESIEREGDSGDADHQGDDREGDDGQENPAGVRRSGGGFLGLDGFGGVGGGGCGGG